jgi:hypothetical protein
MNHEPWTQPFQVTPAADLVPGDVIEVVVGNKVNTLNP